jgi:DNA polymerase-1
MNPKAPLKQPDRNLLLVIDGHSLIYRSWYGIPLSMVSKKLGVETKAVYGFINAFFRSISEWSPTHCAVAFDPHGPTFRHKDFPAYKAHRKPSPPEIPSQVEITRQLMELLNVPVIEVDGYEADDVLGSLASSAESLGFDTVIITGDTDTLQLVSDRTRVHMQSGSSQGKVFDVASVIARLGGLPPGKQPELKGLQGDSSDNIPGVKGIGPKIATTLISQYETLEGVYSSLDDISPRVQRLLEEGKDNAFLSRYLGTIVTPPLPVSIDDCRFGDYNRQKVIDFLRDLEFISIIPRLPNPASPTVESQTIPVPLVESAPEIVVVKTNETLSMLQQILSDSHPFSLWIDDTRSSKVPLPFITIATHDSKVWYLPIDSETNPMLMLSPILENRSIPKIVYNANATTMALKQKGTALRGVIADIMVASHLANRPYATLESIAMDYLGAEIQTSKQFPMDMFSAADSNEDLSNLEQLCKPVSLITALREHVEADLESKNSTYVYQSIEIPLIPVLTRMQNYGVALNPQVLTSVGETVYSNLKEHEAAIYDHIGHEFNLNSPRQLSDVLFQELAIPKTKRTKSGIYSTEASQLEALIDSGKLHSYQETIIEHLLRHRELAKLKSTYLDTLPNLINATTQRIHTTYHQSGTTTGRISSSNPNLQNIPVRSDLGARIRNAFVTENPEAWNLVAADYSQIELRILAHLSEDNNMLTAFAEGEDIHATTASEMFNVAPSKVNASMRRQAKALNFGVVYGLSPFGVAKQLNITVEEGNRYIESYFNKYPKIYDYLEQTKILVSKTGYVETVTGRRRYIAEINATNAHVRQAAERMAINMPVQGTAADIIKLAMIQLDAFITTKKLQTKLLLQVHDELIFDAPLEETGILLDAINRIMPSVIELRTKLEVDVKSGLSWGALEPVTK